MIRRRTVMASMAGMAATAPLVAGCSGGGGGSEAKAPDSGALDKADGETTVAFWHSMDGTNGDTLEKLVKAFNEKNSGKITIKPVYQGEYDDGITKYKAAVQSGSTPALVQIYDLGLQFMIDSGTVVPMQSFIDRDSYDVSDIQPNIAGYYTVADKLWSMPFNTSMPVLYYNKKLFEKAGLDPDKAPETLDEVAEAAKALSKKNDGPAEFGFNGAIYGWFVEQIIATAGELYCTPDNGRGDERASAFAFDNDAAVEFLTWWKKLVDDGIAGNTGRAPADAQDAFKSGTIGITLESTGALGGMKEAADEQDFELGVGFYPRIEKSAFGPVIGGASLYVVGEKHSDAEKEAAWKFVQFCNEPANQATWHTGTGYFPVSKKALDEPEDTKWRKDFPQFDVAIQQLDETELSTPTQGGTAGIMPQARKAVEEAWEGILQGDDPKEGLTKAVKGLQSALDQYNDSAG